MKTTRLLLIFSIFCFLSFSLQLTAQYDGYTNNYIGDFRWGLFVPPDYDPEVPHHLILYLHGHSDTTSWNFQWYSSSWQEDYPTIVVTPKCEVEHTDGWGDSWSMEESWAMGKTFQALDTVFKYYNVDTTRMHVGGTSMGSFGTFYVLASHPGMFASAWATCGGGDPATAPLLKDTPLWIFHGSNDDVVPVRYSRMMYYALLDIGGELVRYTEYPGVGHNAWDYVGQEYTLYPWLFAQQLGAEHGYPDPAENYAAILNEDNHPELSWDAPSDQSGEDKYIWAYRIYRDSVLLETLNNNVLSFEDTEAEPDSFYTYSVAAMNYFFHEAVWTGEIEITTGPEPELYVPVLSALSQLEVYPNPVHERVNIALTLVEETRLSLEIYSTLGQRIDRVCEGIRLPGEYHFEWMRGNIPEGVYLLVIREGKNTLTRKMVVGQ